MCMMKTFFVVILFFLSYFVFLSAENTRERGGVDQGTRDKKETQPQQNRGTARILLFCACGTCKNKKRSDVGVGSCVNLLKVPGELWW